MKHFIDDTIAAVATSTGEAGIGIIRVSGPKALSIADKIFISRKNARPSRCRGYTMHYGWIRHNAQPVDEVLLSVMRKPASYTREDVVEINCHGGLAAQRAVLEAVLATGARLARPGEFTKRAFLNGRIDLTQAEAVLGMIKARTDTARAITAEQLKGLFSRQMNAVRNQLVTALARLQAAIEFPEEDLSGADAQEIRSALERVAKRLEVFIDQVRAGKIFRDGITVVICGRTNVGKSSLMNAILKHERSIVTPVAGTTRDIIEESVDIKGIPVRIIDTAGLLAPRDEVEEQAVARTKRCIAQAAVVLVMFDAGQRLTAEDKRLIRKTRSRRAIAVLNKIDRPVRLQRSAVAESFEHVIEISARRNRNIRLLEDEIFRVIMKDRVHASEPAFVSSGRQIEELSGARRLIMRAVRSLGEDASLECVAQDIQDAVGSLDDVLGKRFTHDVLDRIFNMFCVGK